MIFCLYLVTTISQKIPKIQDFKNLHHTAQKSGVREALPLVHNKSRTHIRDIKEYRCNYLSQEEQM